MTELLVGVLIHIPEHMIELYETAARDSNRSFEEVVAEDCDKICQVYFSNFLKTGVKH